MGDLVVSGHGISLAGGELSYGVAAELLRDLVRQVGAEQVRDSVGGHAAVLATLHPVFADDSDADGTAGTGGPADRASLFGAVHTVLLEVTRDRLLCVAVDDLQWVDASSRALVGYLAKVSMYTPLLLVCNVRSAPSDQEPVAGDLAELSRIPGSQLIGLGPLSPNAVAECVEALSGQTTNGAVARVQRLSEGVPLYVEELVAAAEEMTTTLRVNLAGRLNGLEQETLRFLRAAAVGAGHADEGLVAQVADIALAAAAQARENATARGLLAASGEAEVRFRHALLRDATLAGLGRVELADIHRRWALVLAQPRSARQVAGARMVLAQHWYACGDHEQALVSALEAARSAEERGGLPEAALWWERALGLWDLADEPEELTGVTRNFVLKNTMTKLFWVATHDALMRVIELCERELEQDSSTGGDDWVLTLFLRLRAAWVRRLVDGTTPTVVAAEEFDATAEALLAEADHELVAMCLTLLAQTDPVALSDEVLERLLDRVTADVERGEDRSFLPGTLVWRDYVLSSRGGSRPALVGTRRLVELVAAGEIRPGASVLAQALLNFATYGHFDDAVAFFEAVAGRDLGMPAVLLWGTALESVADVLFSAGDWDRAVVLWSALEEAGADRVSVSLWRLGRAHIAALRGETAAAVEHLALARENLAEPGDAGSVFADSGELALTITDLAVLQGRPPGELVELLLRSLDASEVAPLSGLAAGVLLRAAQCLASQTTGRQGGVAVSETVAVIRGHADRLPRCGRLGVAWSAELDVRLDELEGQVRDPEAWRRVVAAWDEVRHPYHCAVARGALAEALLLAGDRRAASAVVEEALTVAEGLGAQPLAQRLRGLGRSSGVRGAGASTLPAELGRLTSREAEVLALVSSGKTNDQIAAELFMSPKTASVHVSRIITKLGVANRTEAANFAHRHGLAEYDPT